MLDKRGSEKNPLCHVSHAADVVIRLRSVRLVIAGAERRCSAGSAEQGSANPPPHIGTDTAGRRTEHRSQTARHVRIIVRQDCVRLPRTKDFSEGVVLTPRPQYEVPVHVDRLAALRLAATQAKGCPDIYPAPTGTALLASRTPRFLLDAYSGLLRARPERYPSQFVEWFQWLVSIAVKRSSSTITGNTLCVTVPARQHF